jgi:hypothetical protein
VDTGAATGLVVREVVRKVISWTCVRKRDDPALALQHRHTGFNLRAGGVGDDHGLD